MPSRMVSPGITLVGAALPGERPAAGLVADVVGVAAGDVHRLRLARRSAAGCRCRFLSSTCDSATARRATLRCALLPILSMLRRSVNGCSKRPSSNLAVRIRETASSIRLIEHARRPRPDAIRVGMNSLPAIGCSAPGVGLHEHVDAGVAPTAATWSRVGRPGSAGCPASRRSRSRRSPCSPLSTSVISSLVGVHLHRVAERRPRSSRRWRTTASPSRRRASCTAGPVRRERELGRTPARMTRSMPWSIGT